jgi:hypothetical protein
MVQMLPTYTLERLQDTDIDLLLPLYFWYCKTQGKASGEHPQACEDSIVYRGGKTYRKVNPKNAKWL